MKRNGNAFLPKRKRKKKYDEFHSIRRRKKHKMEKNYSSKYVDQTTFDEYHNYWINNVEHSILTALIMYKKNHCKKMKYLIRDHNLNTFP